MKEKAILISVAALLVIAAPVLAQNLGGQSAGLKPSIKMLGILGKGIASLPSDPLNFKIVKAGVGTVSVSILGEQTDLTVGILFLDDQKYTLKDISIGNGSASASLYINDTQHGSISLTSIMKDDTEIWAGTLTLDGTSYNTYIIGGARPIKAAELKEKVSEYCSENSADPNCGGRIQDFCESNPTDNRCLALFKAFCLRKNNIDDSRCRQFMAAWCKDKNETEDCNAFAIQSAGAYCAGHPGTGVCRVIEQKITNFRIGEVNYCAEHSNTIGCKAFCRTYPNKCNLTQTREQACTASGGTVANAACCISASDFPNTCLIGACGCSPENSKEVQVCECGEGKCFNGNRCVNQELEQEQNQNQNQGGQ